MKGAIERALELIAQTPGSWMPQQFENPANIAVHAETTAQEILKDFAENPIDVLITSVGTGGHITSCAEVMKKPLPSLHVYAVAPKIRSTSGSERVCNSVSITMYDGSLKQKKNK